MAWYDGLLGDTNDLSTQDQQNIANQGLLRAGLGILAANGRPGTTPFQAISGGLLGGLDSIQQGASNLQNQRYRQAMMQSAMTDMQRKQQMQALASKFAKPDGTFDMQGYQKALSSIDPQQALEMQQNLVHQKLYEAQAQKAQADAKSKAVRQFVSGNNLVTQEQQDDGTWKPIAAGPRWEPQQSANSALSQQIALMRKFGATDDDIRAKLGIQPQGAQPQNNLTGQDYLNSLSDQDKNMVQAIVDGRYPVPTGKQAMSPQWQALIGAAQQVDPTLDAGSYKSRAAMRQNLTSGKGAQEIKALNTLAGHLQTLSDSLDQMDNSNFSLINRGSNFIGQEFGGKRGQALAQFNTSAKAVGDEAAKVFAGGQSALGDRREIGESLNPGAPNSNLRATIKTYADLVQSRLGAIQEQANQGLGYGSKSIQVVTPKAANTFQRLSGAGAMAPSSQINLNQPDPLGLGIGK